MTLQLVDIVAMLSPVSLLFVQLGPAPSIAQVYKTRMTGTVPLAPLVTMAANGWIWAMYGYVEAKVFPVAVSNFVGFALGAFYTAVYYKHTHDRAYANKVIGAFGLYITVATVYAVAGIHGLIDQSRGQVASVLGYAGILIMLVFFSSPFENIAQVFKHRSNAFIPILLVCAGTVNSVIWATYTLLTSDWFIFGPTLIGLLLGSTQIALYLYFQPQEDGYVELGAKDTSAKDLEAASVELSHHGLNDDRILPLSSPLRTPPTSYGTSSQ